MGTEDLVFLKQIVDNAEYASETGVLNVIRLFKHPDPSVSRGTSFAVGAFETLRRLLELRPDLMTSAVIQELQNLVDDQDQRVRSAAQTALGSAAPGEAADSPAAPPNLTGEALERTKPASPRTAALSGQMSPQELAAYLKEHFSPPEWPYDYLLTPGELCDLVDLYADRLLVRWSDKDQRLLTESDVYVGLRWVAHPDREPISLVGLWTFRTPQEARSVWIDEGVYSDSVPVEQVLDIRDRFALNFRHGSYFVEAGVRGDQTRGSYGRGCGGMPRRWAFHSTPDPSIHRSSGLGAITEADEPLLETVDAPVLNVGDPWEDCGCSKGQMVSRVVDIDPRRQWVSSIPEALECIEGVEERRLRTHGHQRPDPISFPLRVSQIVDQPRGPSKG